MTFTNISLDIILNPYKSFFELTAGFGSSQCGVTRIYLNYEKMGKIERLNFKYKKEVLAHFKKILNSYGFKESLSEEDFNDVFNLLKIHPNAKEKIGVGIKKIKVDETRYKTKCFNVIRVDSSCEIFSYIKCINGSLAPLTKFSKACRDTISEKFRKYHKEKSNLRLVRKEKNLGRSHQARIKRQKKDLIIE
jgi:hypothetical protein